MDRGAWWGIVHGVAKSQTRLSDKHFLFHLGFSGGSDGKASACNAGDLGLIPGSGRSPRERKGYPFQCTHTQSTHNKPAHRDWLISAPLDKEGLLPDSRLLSLAQQGTPTGNPPIPGRYTQLRGCGKVPITFGSVEIHLHRGIPTGVQDFPGPDLLYGHDG